MFKDGNSLLHRYGILMNPLIVHGMTSFLKYLLDLGLSLEAENDVS